MISENVKDQHRILNSSGHSSYQNRSRFDDSLLIHPFPAALFSPCATLEKKGFRNFCTILWKLSQADHCTSFSLPYCVLSCLAREWEVFGRYGADRTSSHSHFQLIKCQMRWNRKWNPFEEAADAGLMDKGGVGGAGCCFPLVPQSFKRGEEFMSETDDMVFRVT